MKKTRQKSIATATLLSLWGCGAIAAGDGGYRHDPAPMGLPEYLEPQQTPFALPELPPELVPRSRTVQGFLLRDLRFSGNTLFDRETLLQVVDGYIGRQVGIDDLEEIRLRLTRHYIAAGHVNSGALLPDQRITDGVVEFRIVEGRLNEIRVEGAGRLDPDYLRGRLWDEPAAILDTNRLQERFQLLLADPLIDRLNGVLRPGVQPGEGLLDLQVTRAKPYALTLFADNHRAPSVGSEEVGLDGRVDNLFGIGDRWRLGVAGSEGAWEGSASASLPLNARDTRLSVYLEHDDSSVVEEPLQDLDIESRFDGAEIGISHPLINRLNRRLTLEARLAWRTSETSLLGVPFAFSEGVEEDGKARSRVLRLIQEYTARWPEQVLAARSTFNIGLDALGATIHDDGQPDGRFVSWFGQLQYARRFPESGAQLVLRGELQLANDALLSLERYSLGGSRSVRGYRESEYLRDNGALVSAEYRWPLFGNPQNDRQASLQLVPFVDAGLVWDKGGRDDAERLSSVGLGLLWRWERLNAELFVAHAFESRSEHSGHDLQDDGIHLRVSLDLF